MFALGIYVLFALLIVWRVRSVSAPVLLRPLAVTVLHVVYFVIVLCACWGEPEEVLVGVVITVLVVGLVAVFRFTIVSPFDRAYIDQQVTDACRMLRIDQELHEGHYVLRTKAGESTLSMRAIALGALLGTMTIQQPHRGDAKVVLFGKLLKKKFASVVPHITINLKKHDSN